MTTAFKSTLTEAFALVGIALAPTIVVSGVYSGDKVWDIDIDDNAAQNDSDTLWSGANIDNITHMVAINRSGWTIGLSLNGNGNVSLTPNSFQVLALSGSLSVVQNVDDPLEYVEYELTSASGTPGKLSVVFLGVKT